MDKPFTLLVLPTILGILLSYYIKTSMGVMLVFTFLFCFLFLYNIYKKRSNIIIIISLFLLIGMMVTNLNISSRLSEMLDIRKDYTGTIHQVIKTNDSESKYVVLVEAVDNKITPKEKIIIKIIGYKQLKLGDRIKFNGVLYLPMTNTNPNLFNYRLSLLSNKIYAIMTVKEFSVERLEGNIAFKYTIKERFSSGVKAVFGKYLNDENKNLMTSIILGDSTYLDEESLTRYRGLGLAHILAVSGLHIGIITGFLLFLFSRIGVKRKYNVVIVLSIIWVYGYLIGFPPSTVRASFMFTVLYYSMLLHEPYDRINTLCATMLLLLLINPFWLFSVSFILSFIATFSIVILNPKIVALVYPYKGKMVQALSTIISVNIGLLPVQIYYFNAISILGVLANFITIPLLSISLILGMLILLLENIIPFLNAILGSFLNIILNIVSNIVTILYNLPLNTINFLSPDIGTICLYYLMLAIIFKIIDLNIFDIKINKLIFYYLLIYTFSNSLILSLDQSINIHFIDVGQGDAILIETQNQKYLIDTGGSIFGDFDIGQGITLPYLRKIGINKLDGIIISHFDEDHCGGLSALIEGLKVNNIYAGYMPDKNYSTPITLIKENDVIILDNNTKLEFIWPDKFSQRGNLSGNNKSLVCLLTYYDKQILFTGDIEMEVESILIDKIKNPVDILKVAHHGSKTSSTLEFIENVSPRHSIISVGRNNFYGHPNKEVLNRLESIDSTIYRTDEKGLIKVILNKNNMEITHYLKN